MKEVLIVAGVALIGYWVYTQCTEKPKQVPENSSAGGGVNYTTPPVSAPMSNDNAGVRQFDARPVATVSPATTTIKVGINEPNDVKEIV